MADYKLIGTVAVIFIVLGVVLALGSKITDDLQTEMIEYTVVSGYKQNWHPANSTLFYLDKTRVSSFEARNSTGNELLAAANYTLSETLGTVVLNPTSSYNNTNLNLTYSYDTVDSVAYDAAGNGTAAVGKLAKNLPLIGLIVIASIIIGTVLISFRRRF